MFDSARPSPSALLAFQKGLLKLKGAGIPMYAIAGNHDVVNRNGAIPPQVLFKKFGLKLISTINTNYMHDDVFIAGLPFLPASQNKNLKSKLDELSKKAENHEKSIRHCVSFRNPRHHQRYKTVGCGINQRHLQSNYGRNRCP